MPSRRPRIPRRPTRLGSPGRGFTLATAAVSSVPFGPPTTTTAPVLRGAVLFGSPAGARLRWRRRGRRRCSPLWGGQVVLPRSPPPPFLLFFGPRVAGRCGRRRGVPHPGGADGVSLFPPSLPFSLRAPSCAVPCLRAVPGWLWPVARGRRSSGARGRVGRGVKDRGQVVQGIKVGGKVVPDDKDQ